MVGLHLNSGTPGNGQRGAESPQALNGLEVALNYRLYPFMGYRTGRSGSKHKTPRFGPMDRLTKWPGQAALCSVTVLLRYSARLSSIPGVVRTWQARPSSRLAPSLPSATRPCPGLAAWNP